MSKIFTYLPIFCLTLLLVGLALPGYTQTPKRVVSGVVREGGSALSQATISEKGMPSNATTSGPKGEFHLTLKGNSSIIIISHVGLAAQEIKIKDINTPVTVVLKPEEKGLEEATVVGFGNVKQRGTETGAVSSINAKEIEDVPTSSVQNALAGEVAGFVAVQRSGQPGRDASDF